MMRQLPAWAQNDEARALIAAVRIEQPDYRDTHKLPGLYGGHREPVARRYRGRNAAALRAMHSRWFERELALLDAQYAVTHIWDQDASNALFRTEDADRLIARSLEWPQVPFTPMEWTERPDGSARVAA